MDYTFNRNQDSERSRRKCDADLIKANKEEEKLAKKVDVKDTLIDEVVKIILYYMMIV